MCLLAVHQAVEYETIYTTLSLLFYNRFDTVFCSKHLKTLNGQVQFLAKVFFQCVLVYLHH